MRFKHNIFFFSILALVPLSKLCFAQKNIDSRYSEYSNRLAELNSKFELANDNEKDLVWAIIQIKFYSNPEHPIEGGATGAGWIIEKSKNYIVLVTAGHVMESTFESDEDKPDSIHIFISHFSGLSCRVYREDIEIEDQDIALIWIPFERFGEKLSNLGNTRVLRLPSNEENTESKRLLGQYVCNLGFPDRAKPHFSFYTEPSPSVTFEKGPWVQKGNIIADIDSCTVTSKDVNLRNAKCLVLDYASERGFSGGPLFFDDEIVGMVSAVVPKKDGSAPTKTIAIHINQISSLFDKHKNRN